MAKMYDEKKEAIRVIALLNKFDGDVENWRNAFYELWRLQMTFSYAYRIELQESRRSGVFVDLLIKPDYLQQLLGSMETLGYREITQAGVEIGIVDFYEHEGLDDIEELILDY